MAWKSLIWNGVSVGDALVAPYDKTNFNLWLAGPLQANSDDGFVIPGYLNDLEVTPITGSRIRIDSGGALIQNYIFINDAPVVFAISGLTTAGQYRYDSIVLRLDTEEQEIRIAVLNGTESAFPPVAPTLTQTGQIWEVEIARVYISETTFTPVSTNIEDKRKFLLTFKSMNNFSNRNLVRNSEFMVSSITSMPVRIPFWQVYNRATSTLGDAHLSGSALSPMLRGRSIKITSNLVNSGVDLYQKISVRSGVKTYSVRGLVKIDPTNYGTIYVSLYGIRADGSTETSKRIYIALRERDTDLDFSGTVTFEETDIKYIVIKYATVGIGSLTEAYVGQPLVTEGYHPGPYRQITETLLTNIPVTDTDFTADAFSTGTTALDLTDANTFFGFFQKGAHAILGLMIARDSASAASATAKVEIEGSKGTVYATVPLQGAPNDTYVHRPFIVNAIQDLYVDKDTRPQIGVDITATGAGTLDLTLYLNGEVTV